MEYRVSELEGALLDAAVAKAEGIEVVSHGHGHTRWDQDHGHWRGWNPSTDWRDGGPIIQREHITIVPNTGFDDDGPVVWVAFVGAFTHYIDVPLWNGAAETPLIASMRAYVASKFGDVVELP